jgi:hypothetical protein
MLSNKPILQSCRQLLLTTVSLAIVCNSFSLTAQSLESQVTERRITVSEYRDKMMAGWIGQMVGVGWGAPTEFRYMGEIIPADSVPTWVPKMVNVFGQDDLYVEMTFLRTLEVYGFDVSSKQAGIDFANSGYMLWHANRAGRENLRNGITPPNSGHPNFSQHSDDIDYQIEADFSGLIAPGLPNTVISLGEKFGSLMNYGDGIYGGQFVGGLYAEAFFEDDPVKIVKTALGYIPAGSQYAEAIRDVLNWHAEQPDDWEATWLLIDEKYNLNPEYRQYTCAEEGSKFNIDAKLNGAYIAMGLLYGNNDLDETTKIAMRCGQDSDCNPSNAAGALFTTRGFKNLTDKYISDLDRETKFSFTDYTFPELIDICEKLATDAILRAGGRVEVNANGEEEFVIPVITPVPSKLEQSHAPGPISDSEFTKAELKQLEGHWLFKYSLIFLVILAFAVFKENRNLKTTLILVPLAIIVIVAEVIKSTLIDPEMLGMLDIIVLFESLATALAIMLLISHRFAKVKWFVSFIIAAIVLAVIGFAGVTGGTEGRIIASTSATLYFFALQAIVWLLAVTTAALLSQKKYSRLRFNLLTIISFFIFHLIGMYLITTLVWFLGPDISFILISALIFTLIHYLIILPFFILAYKNEEYGERLLSWIKVS